MSRQPKIGDRIATNLIPSLVGKELVIKSTLLETVFARPKFAREDVELQEGDFIYLEPEKLTAAEKAEIIKRLVKPDFIKDVPSFRREQGALNRLIEKYQNADFWKDLQLGFQLRSLNWFFGGGADQIRFRFNEFSLDTKPATYNNSPVTLREEKIGADVPIVNKPKNLLDILN